MSGKNRLLSFNIANTIVFCAIIHPTRENGAYKRGAS